MFNNRNSDSKHRQAKKHKEHEITFLFEDIVNFIGLSSLFTAFNVEIILIYVFPCKTLSLSLLNVSITTYNVRN